jgi:hypothetical protein
MSRRGKNNVMRSIVHDASSIFSTTEAQRPKAPTAAATNNYNPLFHYLQTMFPNYDNAVLNAVLEQEGNSIERAVEVLLTFAVPEAPKDDDKYNEKEPAEITFGDDFSDTEESPSNVFAVPAMPPVTSHNSGRDHVSLYEQTRKKRKATKSQRARRRQRAQVQAAAAAAAAAKSKKVKWVPLEEFIVESKNPYDTLPLEEEPESSDQLSLLLSPNLVEQPEQLADAAVVDEENEETQSLLTQEEIEESWEDFEATQQEVDHDNDDEPAQLQSPSDSGSESEEWLHYTPSSPQEAPIVEEEEDESVFASSSSGEEEEEDGFVVIDEQETLPLPQEETLPAATPVVEDERSEQVVVVKLYYSASDIHRLGLTRRTLNFAKLYDYAATYLQSKCQQAKADLPLAFALTYLDDEGDTIHLCSEEELAEALRLHDDVFWTDGKQPLLRLHIKSLEVAANDGHIVV